MYSDELGLHIELTRDVRDHKMRTAAVGTPAKAATRGNFEVNKNSGIFLEKLSVFRSVLRSVFRYVYCNYNIYSI